MFLCAERVSFCRIRVTNILERISSLRASLAPKQIAFLRKDPHAPFLLKSIHCKSEMATQLYRQKQLQLSGGQKEKAVSL
jgi:hypothetical protein